MLHYWSGSCTLVLFLRMTHKHCTCILQYVRCGPLSFSGPLSSYEKNFIRVLRGDFKRDCNRSFSLTFPSLSGALQLKPCYIQSKGWKVVYDSFLFRLSVWNLCGLKVSTNPCGWLHCLGSAISRQTSPCLAFGGDFRLSREAEHEADPTLTQS